MHTEHTGFMPLLPTTISPISPPSRNNILAHHAKLFLLAMATLSTLVLVSSMYQSTTSITSIETVEPEEWAPYQKFHESEAQLSQYYDGESKYLWISNHLQNAGWGNAMQELVLNAHLAYTLNRAFVFDNFTWDRDGDVFTNSSGKPIPYEIPLSAMIDGPIVGGPFPPSTPSPPPRAISKEYFKEICPNPTLLLSEDVITDSVMRYDSSIGASVLFNKWVDKLKTITDPCVEVSVKSQFEVFEFWIFGSRRILDIWPSLSLSPILTEFEWSKLIQSAFKTNINLLLSPPSWLSSRLSDIYNFFSAFLHPHHRPGLEIPGLLVLHIRRGDFDTHCVHLSDWWAEYNGFNAFPELPDQFVAPPRSIANSTKSSIYMEHCYPSIPQIVRKVQNVRNSYAGGWRSTRLKRIYIMTNAPLDWLSELKTALRAKEEGKTWEGISTSWDLELNWEERNLAQTVDMMIGHRAQVFIGNGFSSMTSNIVMLRMAHGVRPDANRFW